MPEARTYSPRRLPEAKHLAIAAAAAVLTSTVCAAPIAWLAHIGGARGAFVAVAGGWVLPGLLTAWLCRRCRVAHYASVAVLALIAANLFNYSFAVVRLWLVYDSPPLLPGEILFALRQLPQGAVWVHDITGKSTPVSRSDAQLFALAHVALLLGLVLSPLMAWLVSRYQPPVCQQCNQWLATPAIELAAKPPCPPFRFAYQLSQQQYDLLSQLEPEPNHDREPHLRFAVFTCPDCGGEAYLNVWEVRYDDSAGKTQRAEHRIIRHQIIGPEITAQLKAIEDQTFLPLTPEPRGSAS